MKGAGCENDRKFLIQCKTRKMEVLQFLVAAFGGYVFGIIVMMIIRANTVEKNV